MSVNRREFFRAFGAIGGAVTISAAVGPRPAQAVKHKAVVNVPQTFVRYSGHDDLALTPPDIIFGGSRGGGKTSALNIMRSTNILGRGRALYDGGYPELAAFYGYDPTITRG